MSDDDDIHFDGAGAPPEEQPTPEATSGEQDKVPAAPINTFTTDDALIFAILQAGISGYFAVRDKGIRPEHVQDEAHRVFNLIADFARKGRMPTLTEIKAATGIAVDIPDEPFDVDLFANKISSRALKIALRDGLKPVVYGYHKDPVKAREDLIAVIRNTAWSSGGVSSYTDPTSALSIFNAYEKAKNKTGDLLGLSSPWPSIDNSSLGLQNGELTVLLAKRKVGKSWVLFKWLQHIWRNDLKPGECILLVSMEMPLLLVWRRFAALDLNLCYEDFRGGKLASPAEQRFYDWVEEMKNPDPSAPRIYVAGPNVIRTVEDIASKAAELNPRIVGIDGFYILGRDRKMSMWERTMQNVSEIKLDLCSQLDVPVLATTQVKGSKDKQALDFDADDAAFAKAIGDYADAMRGLAMNDAMEAAGERNFLGMETREFKPVSVCIRFDLDHMRFDEMGDAKVGKKKKDDEAAFDGAGAPPDVKLAGEDPDDAGDIDSGVGF